VVAPTDHLAATTRPSRFDRPVQLYWISFLATGLSLSILGPAVTELRERSGADIGDIGVLFAGQSAGFVVGALVGGRLYDRFDGHRVFAGALTVVACGLALVPSLSSLLPLFGAFVLVGVGASAADVGANALLLWELGPGSGRAMNVLHLCFGLGALSSPLFVYLDLDLTLRLVAFVSVVLAGVALRTRVPAVRVSTAEQHADTTPRLLALLAVFFFLYVGLEIGFAGWVRTYGEEIGFSGLAATWVTTTFWVGFTSGRLLASAFAQRVRPKVLLAVACSATVVAAAVLVVGDGRAPAVWFGSALMGLSTAPQFPVMFTYLERRIHVSGYATSWFVGAAGVGGLVFPWLIGRWIDASGPTALPWAMLVLGLATLGSFALSHRRLGG
jgi:fucose permease